jgi:hypothetical protein
LEKFQEEMEIMPEQSESCSWISEPRKGIQRSTRLDGFREMEENPVHKRLGSEAIGER